jgi:hypothetical protein
MLYSFNQHSVYFNKCVSFILMIVLENPQFNNYKDICELIDIYLRKFVENNSNFSSIIYINCYDMVRFFYPQEYIDEIRNSFKTDAETYHYLAILVQFQRMANKFKLLSQSYHHHYVPDYMVRAVMTLG